MFREIWKDVQTQIRLGTVWTRVIVLCVIVFVVINILKSYFTFTNDGIPSEVYRNILEKVSLSGILMNNLIFPWVWITHIFVHEEAVMKKNITIGTAMIGHALEHYDVTLYGFFAAMLAPLFFPSDYYIVSLIASWGTFALGFLMRPLGGLVFGHLGDLFGRKKALLNSILVASFPLAFRAQNKP